MTEKMTFVPGYSAVFSGEIIATFTRETADSINARSSVSTVDTLTETYRKNTGPAHNRRLGKNEVIVQKATSLKVDVFGWFGEV